MPTNGTGALSFAFSPDGRTLAVSDDARTVRMWDVSDPAAPVGLPAIPHTRDNVRGLAFSPDGRTLSGGTESGTVMLWHLPYDRLPIAAKDARALAFAPDGRTLATGGEDGRVRLWNLADPARPRAAGTVDIGTGEVAALAFGTDGHTLAVSTWDARDRRVGLWDVTAPGSPRRLDERAVESGGRPPAVSADGSTAVAVADRGIHVWRLAGTAGAAPADRILKAGDGRVGSLAVSSDGRVVGVGHDDGDFSLWMAGDPSPVARVTGVDPGASATQVLALAPDGHALAKSDRATLTVWDLGDPAKPAARGSVSGSSDVESLAFAPSGHLLAEGNADGTIRFVDPARATVLSRTLAAGVGPVTALAFAPDGRTLAGAGEDQPVRLWSTDPEAAARWICTAAGNVITPAQWAQYVPGLAYEPPCDEQG
ncbi:WD40 repeat domain-containing protein [Streptomyces sp. NPDC127092]|uniref:WD40 repeat domain-containing protein n=1 Tax=Streptomyces sp. NPDC127092 TaxID=3347135 RepID=UPI00366797C6